MVEQSYSLIIVLVLYFNFNLTPKNSPPRTHGSPDCSQGPSSPPPRPQLWAPTAPKQGFGASFGKSGLDSLQPGPWIPPSGIRARLLPAEASITSARDSGALAGEFFPRLGPSSSCGGRGTWPTKGIFSRFGRICITGSFRRTYAGAECLVLWQGTAQSQPNLVMNCPSGRIVFSLLLPSGVSLLPLLPPNRKPLKLDITTSVDPWSDSTCQSTVQASRLQNQMAYGSLF